MGKTKSLASDFPFLTPIDRTPHAIEEAKKQIEQSESKLLYSLFWFWKNNTADELAFEVLKKGDTEKAISIWEKSALSNKHKIFKPIVLNENLIVSSSHFEDTDSENHILKKNGDEYLIERKTEDNYSIPTAFYELNFDDNWTIECDTEWLDGVDNESYGLIFGRDKGSYYFFGIAGSDSFIYGKYNDWNYTSYIKWKDTPKFNKWSTNHIQIKKVESQLSFFVNGVLVDTWEAEPFFGKNFGFRVTKKQKISFRNFKFSKLVEHEIYGEGINVSSKNFSNIKNLSTLYLSLATNNGALQLEYFKKGIALAKNFFTTENIEEYSKLIAGERYIYNLEKTLHFYINDVIDSLRIYLDKSGGISTSQLINSFSNFPVEAKQFLNNRFVAKQIKNIDKEIEIAQTERKKSAATANDAGKKLVSNTKADIDYLKKVLGKNDFQYQIIGDKLSLAIVQCGIDAFNYCKTSNGEIDYPNAIKSEESYLHEYEYAMQVAATKKAKERAKVNLDSCKHLIENKFYYSCWFCGTNPPNEGSKFERTIYKETSRSNFFTQRTVQFSYVPVSIPRCSHCQKTHSESSGTFTGVFIAGAVIGLIVGAMADGYWFAGLLVGGAIGWIIGTILKNKKISKPDIKDTNQSSIKNYPTFKKMLSEGWQFSKPSA